MNERNGATHRLAADSTARVLICRSCCCGTLRKHPKTDHEGQVAAISAVARTRVVDCLGECAHSNVVVVRGGDGSAVWLGGVNDTALTDAVCGWLAAGATQPPPPILESKVFIRRPRAAEPLPSAAEREARASESQPSAVRFRQSGAVGADAEDVEPVVAGLEAAGV